MPTGSTPEFDALYEEQNQELDEERRVESVHEMLRIFHESAVYIPITLSPDLQAYRTDTFEGWVRQPAEVGPVFFSMSSPSYVLLTPVGGEGPDQPTETTSPGDDGDTTTTTPSDSPGTTVTDGGETPGDDGDGVNWPLIIGIAVVVVGGGALLASRRKSEDERE
jgi:peptide/nickel transport system substrate-binding protein